ncbi:MAG: STAS/SEC14 domain-containing protein [Bacteroidetes bacterium]|nr:STAS/SEC14 domain-containing protein [Bacteroidota bacterium]
MTQNLWNKVETRYVKIWQEEAILYCVFADKLNMDLEIAKHCVNERIQFSQGKDYPCLINMKGLKSVTKEAREYMSTEGEKNIIAAALLIGSPLSKMIGNIFLSLNKPKVPAKLFTNENEAKEWLNKYK